MTRTSPPPVDQTEYPVLICSIEQNSAYKLDGAKSGKLTLTFDSSQAETIMELWKHYGETELHVTFIKVAT